MKIILESIDDLDALITYFNYGYETKASNDADDIQKLNSKINNLIEQIGLLLDNKPVETNVNKSIRVIREPYSLNINRIDELTPEGKFKRNGNGAPYFKWTIQDLLRIRNAINDSKNYPTIKSITKMVGLSDPTVNDLIYYIENGDFDKYFNEWEQIQANKFFKKERLNVNNRVINDPQKRRENGLI